MIYVLNGPNLNLLGKREPAVYGQHSLAHLEQSITEAFPATEIKFCQTNHEGELIEAIQQADGSKGIVLNPGGYGHTSVAILDALRAVSTPTIEVHLSNVHAREEYRQHLLTAKACVGVISGLGIAGYIAAVRYLLEYTPSATQ